MFEFFSALFSQRNTIKEDKQTNKAFTKRKKEVLSVLKDLDDIDLNFSTKARLDIEKLDKILKDNEAIIELSFGNLLEEALTTLDLIENKAIEIKNKEREAEKKRRILTALEGASDPEVIKSLLSELSNKWYK